MVRIGAASSREADTLFQIERQCFTAEGFTARQLRYLLDKARAGTWIAWEDHCAQGYCMGLFPSLPRPSRLYSIAVLPRHRGKGIARLLVDRFLEESRTRGYCRARLEVNHTNKGAISLYQSIGFRAIQKLPAYYPDGAEALRMQLDFT